jgi:hypothetical protein
METRIYADLKELETMLFLVSETIKDMLRDDVDSDAITT